MGTVPATEFKAKCLELMDRVAEGRETYVITKRGKPVAKLVPVDPAREGSVFGCLTEQTESLGDLETSAWTDEEWKALERQRFDQGQSWEGEWRRRGTISGKKPAGRPVPLPLAKHKASPARRRQKG